MEVLTNELEKGDGETGQQAGQEQGQLLEMESIGTVIVGEENKEMLRRDWAL